MKMRLAEPGDLAAVCAIYNEEVLGAVATFDTEPREGEAAAAWFESHQSAAHPLVVADIDGTIAGWACLSSWSPRGAYARTAEGSVFVGRQFRDGGLGAKLLEHIVELARARGPRVVLGRIEAANAASRRMLERCGFRSVGTMHAVGEKFGRILDVEVFEIVLDASPPGAA
jgi:phosphinothricin acetyltransferase